MPYDLVVTTIVLVAAIALFYTEWIPAGQTAMAAAAALLITGVLSGEDVYAGFANPATITVGSMFVVSAAVLRTGAVRGITLAMGRLIERGEVVALAALCFGAGAMSAFINNTTVVAIMLPILLQVTRDAEVSSSRYLMPMAFASVLGGTCTLIGTSTNLIVSSMAEDAGLSPIGMFELAPVGLVLFGAGIVYLLTAGRALIPKRRGAEPLDESFGVTDYIADVRLDEDCSSIGRTVANAPLLRDIDGDVIGIERDGESIGGVPTESTRLCAGDVLRLRIGASDLPALISRKGTIIEPAGGKPPVESEDIALVEVVVGPRSPLAGRRVADIPFRDRFDAVVLAVRHRDKLSQANMGEIELRSGDVLLLGVSRDSMEELEQRGEFLIMSEVSESDAAVRRAHMPIALAALAFVVTSAATGFLSIAAAAMVGAVAVVVTGCVRLDEAVEAVDWNVLMLLAGVIALGAAMETSGATASLANGFVDIAGDLGPHLLVGALYVGTTLFTSVMSNNATAALLTPLAVAIASQVGINPRPLVMAIAFGASTAFLTPVGYQTNTMVYGAGRYRFLDFTRTGGPLVAVLAVIAAALIPVVWPVS